MFQTMHQPSSERKASPIGARPNTHVQPGNQAMLRRLQAKFAASQPGDPAELEADRVADHVMRMRDPVVSRKCAECEEEDAHRLQTKNNGRQQTEITAPPVVHKVLSSPGQPLDQESRAFFEPRFGADFSKVRVHSDALAVQSARAVNALAYVAGHHIVLGSSATYGPTPLLAHELAHVVQQGATVSTNGRDNTIQGQPSDPSIINRKSEPAPKNPENATEKPKLSDCDANQSAMIAAALTVAQRNLRKAVEEVDGRPLSGDMKNALWLYFRDSSETKAAMVSKNLTEILNRLPRISYECENDCPEEELGYTRFGAMLTGLGSIHLCVNNIEPNADQISDTIIHEAAHYVLLAFDSAGYYKHDCSESETTVSASPGDKLSLADSYRCFVRNLISSTAHDRAEAKADISGETLTGIIQGPPGPVDLNAPSKKPVFIIRSGTRITGAMYRWILRDPQGRSYAMTDVKGHDLFQFKTPLESVNAYIHSATRDLLKERGVKEGHVLCRARSPVFGERLFELPVTFVY